MELAFPPGMPPTRQGPLSRFLPPIEPGAVTRFLESYPLPDGWLLDPFGTSPTLAIEAARARGVVAAFSNPVVRFVLENRLRPIDPGDLRAVLALLATAPKDNTRLERFLLDLYRTECHQCGAAVSADYFVWDRELAVPVLKVYVCDTCHRSGEDPTTPADRERAAASPGHRLAHALAAERAAPAEDPDREHVEDALAVYPGRAVYALVTILQKLDQLDLTPALRRAAEALMLSAFDAANGLWGYPETRARPRQLIASQRFREVNVWRALERAHEEWAAEPAALDSAPWPESGAPRAGTLAVFPGPIRELENALQGDAPLILTALPRPNQAFWTLSALWASWLWGRESAAPIRSALRRRRFDWTWHAAALRGAFKALARHQPSGSVVAAFVPEAEAGFLAAALAGLDAAGYRLRGHAIRLNDGQAVLAWEASRHRPVGDEPVADVMAGAAETALRSLGEPASYGWLHAAATIELARRQRLGDLWDEDDTPPLTRLTESMEAILAEGGRFDRLEPRADPESGQYWLASAGATAPPLADRTEQLVLEHLRSREPQRLLDVEVSLCERLRGMQTPDRRLVAACLGSYATPDADGIWRLRTEDEAERRRADLSEIRGLLEQLGDALGYQVSAQEWIDWMEKGRSVYRFRVQETAELAIALDAADPSVQVMVVPGGRASLVSEKERRDMRLRAWLAAGGRFVKFRHVRRLAEEASIHAGNFADRLAIDPTEREDPQLPLL
jgi:hypothetical protein